MLDCIVVGAGIAGLVAALDLADAGLDVVVLEARDRIGGRVENSELADGRVIELGGQWIAPSHEGMTNFVDDYKLVRIPMTAGDTVIIADGNSVRMTPKSREFAYNPFEMADLGQGVVRFEHLVELITSDEKWIQDHQGWVAQSANRWINANLRTMGGRQAFSRVLAETIGEVDLTATTLSEVLRKSLGGLSIDSLVAVTGGLPIFRLEGGIFRICEELARDLGDKIVLNAVVELISRGRRGVKVTTRSGEVYEASRVIVTLPPWLVDTIDFKPSLPSWRQEVTEKQTAGSMIKSYLLYPKPWWWEEGLSGQMGSDVGPVKVMFDASNDENGYGVLMGFFDGEDADEWRQKPIAMRERALMQAAVTAFGERAANPISYSERDWFTEEFTKGCHVPHFTPGLWTVNGSLLAEPEGRIHFAGSEYASKHNGYLEGAVLSARQAVDEVLEAS